MEVFQANQPLSLHRNGEGLQLSVDLSNYATKAEIPDTSDFATKEEVALKADKSELSNYVTTEAYNTKMTELDGEISAIQAQIGNISTTLDTINGEVI
jgi:succinyl-CoA synthetase beta subunit